jgi:hypothetical protein
MPEERKEPKRNYVGGYFHSEDCDVLEIREEDTQPGPKRSEQERKRLAEKYGRKLPPEPPTRE